MLFNKRIENYQRSRFYGFAAHELEQLEVLTALRNESLSSQLNNSVHPMYARDRWQTVAQMPRHYGPVPVRGDHKGYWVAENDVVWNVLRPCIQMASIMLTRAAYLPWWDALFNATRTTLIPIDPRRMDPKDAGKILFSFHAKYPCTVSELDIQKKLLQAARHIKFKLTSGYTQNYTGTVTSDTWGNGVTDDDPVIPNLFWACISLEELQPLLRPDLTDAEKQIVIFRCATTIVHETAHAVWMTRKQDQSLIMNVEPYFEQEVLSELGWSLESHMYGGDPGNLVEVDFSFGGPGLPPMGIWKSDWFTDHHENYNNSKAPVLYVPPKIPLPAYQGRFYTYDAWPISFTWVHSLFQNQTWDINVRMWGNVATQMGPLAIGTRQYHDSMLGDPYQVIPPRGWFSPPWFDDHGQPRNSTPSEEAHYRWETARRARTNVLWSRMFNVPPRRKITIPVFPESDHHSNDSSDDALDDGADVYPTGLRRDDSGVVLQDDSGDELILNETYTTSEIGSDIEISDPESDDSHKLNVPKTNFTHHPNDPINPLANSSSSSEPQCPRWNEITTYLFANRGPEELALDSMNFDIPEPTFYRCIQDRGGIDLSPYEFREFLICADHRSILFDYAQFPGTGAISRLPSGWPEPYNWPTLQRLPPYQGTFEASGWDRRQFLNMIKRPDAHLLYFRFFHAYRDLDIKSFQGFLKWVLNCDYPEWEIYTFIHELYHQEIAADARNPTFRWITFGPKGVVRICWDRVPEDAVVGLKREAYVIRREKEVAERKRTVLLVERENERRIRVTAQLKLQIADALAVEATPTATGNKKGALGS